MHKLVAALAFLAALLGGCLSMPSSPKQPGADPSNPSAPEASARRLHPYLVATTKVYLDPSAGQGADKMDMSKTQDKGGRQEMDPSQMKGMSGMGARPSATVSSPASKKAVEMNTKKTSDEMKRLPDEPKTKSGAAKKSGDKAEAAAKSPAVIYTCSMHAQIKEAKPGQCPICGMTLVKKNGP